MSKKIDSQIIIIGAGLSGLLTAFRLKKAGFTIKILEARGRAGGRINTIIGAEGIPLEMGATWFGPQHQNLIDLLEELKLSAFKQYMEGSAIFDTSPFSPPQLFEITPQDSSFRIVGGTSQLIRVLLEFFTTEEILFNEKVEQIQIEEEKVSIKTSNQIFSANKLICCIPPALLVKTINFVPELPESLIAEAKRTHTWMQESIKAGVIYKKPFWKDEKVATIVSHQGPIIEYYDHSNFSESQFALCGFLLPEYSDLKRTEREKRVIAQLIRLFGKKAGENLGYEEMVWQNEKYTNVNSGETFLPHQNNGNRVFQQSYYKGTVMISNSETSTIYGGYMEGAVYSANQTAKKIIDELRSQER